MVYFKKMDLWWTVYLGTWCCTGRGRVLWCVWTWRGTIGNGPKAGTCRFVSLSLNITGNSVENLVSMCRWYLFVLLSQGSFYKLFNQNENCGFEILESLSSPALSISPLSISKHWNFKIMIWNPLTQYHFKLKSFLKSN